MKILVIIPAYNEEGAIGFVIEGIRGSMPEADILVVNDGSGDNTSAKAAHAGARVLDLPFNLGIGGAMQTGYQYARDHDYDIAIQVDGDGQHNPAYIRDLVAPLCSDTTDMAIGSRYVERTAYKSTVGRRTGMIFFSTLISLLTNQRVKDTTSGFRAVNKKVIQYFARHYPPDYPEVDVLVKLFKKNFRVVEMPVEMNPRRNGRSSITPLRSIYYMIKVSLSLIIGTLRSVEE